MKADFNEQMSALLDGELDRDAQDRAVSRLTEGDDEILDRFGRYRMIGDILRGETAAVPDSVAMRVHQALLDEPTILSPRPSRSRWLKPVAGLAVAASVAVVAVAVAPSFLQQPGTTGQDTIVASTTVQPLAAPAASTVRVNASQRDSQLAQARAPQRWQTLDEQFGAQLNRLVIEHHEFGGRTGINGPVAHIGLVNYAGR